MVGAFLGGEAIEEVTDVAPGGLDRARVGLAQQGLELGETCSIGLRSGE